MYAAGIVRRDGMTLVEMLVVVAVIAVLVSLAVPAVNGAREAGRRSGCIMNQSRIANAMAEHDSRQAGLPGWRNRYPLLVTTNASVTAPNARMASWAVVLLPLMDRIDFATEMANDRQWMYQSGSNSWAGSFAGSGRAGKIFPPYLCPSFAPKVTGYAMSPLHYGVNVGSGASSRDDGAIIDGTVSVRQTFDDISKGDGLSCTMLTSEGCFDSWPGGWGPEWNYDMVGSTAFAGINSKALHFGMNGGPVTKAINGPVGQTWLPRSKHPAGVVITTCDGRAKFVRDSISTSVFAHLLTARSVWAGSSYTPVNSTNAHNWLRGSGAPAVAGEPYMLKESDF
jgi:prepilin-type N-terminal cleavage/methylation domain-containing protein